jgi:erythronate-4-phosphate dehydrogenase
MKIVADSAMPYVAEAFADFGTITLLQGRSITPETVADAEMLLVRSVTPVTRKLIAGSKLKFVATATSGIEHIDRFALQEQGIGCAHAPGSNAKSVAEYIVAALLRLAQARQRKLSGLALGIIGVGHVGSIVMRYAEALGMHSLLNDPPLKRLTGKKIYISLKKVVEASDFLTLHVPLNREGVDATYHLADADLLKRMKPGAVLVNACRGKVVDESAIKEARSRLGALVVDVWDHEPAIDPEYLEIADIATPHIAGYSFDGKVRGTAMIHQGACEFFHRRPAWNAERLLTDFAGSIDVSGSPDPIGQAVMQAYDIASDDARLRPITRLPESERGRFFDGLRASYPKRLEFSHFEVRCAKNQLSEKNTLTTLGFQTTVIDS